LLQVVTRHGTQLESSLRDLLQLPPLHVWQLVLPQLMAALRGTSPAARRLTMVPLRVLAAAAPAAVAYPLAAEMAAAAKPTHPADAGNSARNEAQVRLQIAASTVLKLQVTARFAYASNSFMPADCVTIRHSFVLPLMLVTAAHSSHQCYRRSCSAHSRLLTLV
jgi:hypothetical protein